MNSQDIRNLCETYNRIYDNEVNTYDLLAYHLINEGYANTYDEVNYIIDQLDNYELNSLIEDFVPLNREKANRVMRAMPQLIKKAVTANQAMQSDVSKYNKRKANRVARFLVGTTGPKNRLRRSYTKAKQYYKSLRSAQDALNNYKAGLDASMIKKQNDIAGVKKQLKLLGADPDAPNAKSNIRKFKRIQSEAYELLVSHLLDEGYADNLDSAENILENMSEQWLHSILEKIN